MTQQNQKDLDQRSLNKVVESARAQRAKRVLAGFKRCNWHCSITTAIRLIAIK